MTARAFGLAFLLAGFWLVLSGHYSVLLLVFGFVSVILVLWLARRMTTVDPSGIQGQLRPSLPIYVAWLAWQVLKSSIVVTRQVWSPRQPVRPAVGSTRADGLSEVSAVAYANSITLTPGTLSLRVNDSDIEVHALDQSGLDELDGGGMIERLRRWGAR